MKDEIPIRFEQNVLLRDKSVDDASKLLSTKTRQRLLASHLSDWFIGRRLHQNRLRPYRA